MANEVKEIILKIVIDGKEESVATIKTYREAIDGFTKSIGQTNLVLDSFKNSLLQIDQADEQVIESIADFIRYNQLSEKQIQQVIASLREQQQSLAFMSPEYHKHEAAIKNLTNATERLAAGQIRQAAQLDKTKVMLDSFRDSLLQIDQADETAIQSIADFIRYNQLSERQIQQVITSLREQQQSLAFMSPEFQKHEAAIMRLTAATGMMATGQMQNTQSSGSMRMAVGQLGYALSDASTFMINFRMGLFAIGNNIPMIIQYFQQAAKEAKDLGQTFTKQLVASITGTGGVLLAANAMMVLLTALPMLFNDASKAVKSHAEEVENLAGKYEKLTRTQLDNRKAEVEKDLAKFTAELQAKYGENNKLLQEIGSLIPWPFYGMLEGMTEMNDKEQERYEGLLNEFTALDQVSSKLGYIKNLENEYNLLLEKRKEIKDKDAITAFDNQINYYKKLIDEANAGITPQKPERGKNYDSLANEMAKAEELKGKLHELNILRDESLSQYEKEKKLLEGNYNTNIKSIDAELTVLKSRERQNEISLQKISNLEKEKEVVSAEYKLKRDELDEKHYRDQLKADYDYQQARMELEQKSDEEILQNKREYLQILYFLEKDPEKANEVMRSIELLDLEINKKRIERAYELSDLKVKAKKDELDQEEAEVRAWYDEMKETELYKNSLDAQFAIQMIFENKLDELDQRRLQRTDERNQRIVDSWANAFNSIYSYTKQLADDDINTWKDKEEKKLDEEKKSALKHARTQKERERIDEEYYNRKEKLDEQANAKAREKLLVWFRIQQAANIAQTIMSTRNAAMAALKPAPEGLGPIWGIPLAAATVVAGMANVAIIAAQKIPGYLEGGLLPKGKRGYFEGVHDEIIMPEKTYAQVQAQLVLHTMEAVRQGMADITLKQSGYDADYIKNEINRAVGEKKTVVQLMVGKKIAKEIYILGNGEVRSSR